MNFVTLDVSGQVFKFQTFVNCPISKSIRNNEVWEPHLHTIFNKFINKSSIVVECGCHIGSHTVKLASLCDKLYGFEPMPVTYELLCNNMKLNEIKNTVIYNKGVADKNGRTKYSWIPSTNIGGSGLENNPMGKPNWIDTTSENIEVELITIDSLNLNKLDFMKIDVEGYESLVIKGALETIKKCKPVIIMEVWANHHGSVDMDFTKKTFQELLDVGYSVANVSGPDFLFTPN